MLADVIKQKALDKQQELQEEIKRFNQPYKRDTIIYCDNIHIIGGIETWIQNLAMDYEFSLVYTTANEERLKYFKDLGIECIRDVGQPIECDLLLRVLYGKKEIKAKKTIIVIHADYSQLSKDYIEEIPYYDEIYAVSKVAAEGFKKVTGIEPKVLYNPVKINKGTKPLILGVFSRLSAEKGKKRIEYLIDELQRSKKPFLMLIFTDLPFPTDDNRVVFIPPEMNISGWIEICDYVVQLSDTEAGCYTIQEALKMGKPIIVTDLPILKEFNIDNKVAKIIDFDMSNLDIEDLWEIPKVKWQEPISKEWEFMKKRVLRERQEPKEEIKVEIVKEEPKKTRKKKAE